jgi:preprotein translocase subunit SecE
VGLFLGALIAHSFYIHFPFMLRVSGWIILSIVLLAFSSRTIVGKRFWSFFKEAWQELRKVAWPSRDITVRMTLLIIGIIFLFALFLWGLDSLLMWLINLLTHL